MNRLHHALARALCAAALAGSSASYAQSPGGGVAITLDGAQQLARAASPDIRAARAAVDAARGTERQAGLLSNPTLALDREQTSGGGQSASQTALGVTQLFEIGGQRGARKRVATLRREASEAQLDVVAASLDVSVARSFAAALSADARYLLADRAAATFARAETVTQRRLAAGDVAGYELRRIRLEAARYVALRSEAALARRAARRELLGLIGDAPAPGDTSAVRLASSDSMLGSGAAGALESLAADSLIALALVRRPEARVASIEVDAAAAEGVRIRRDAMPSPSVTAGLLSQRQAAAGDDATLRGLFVGVALPVPLWDRRRGATESATAEVQKRIAERDAVRRRITREVTDAADATRSTREQLAALAPVLGAESAAALRSAAVAYEEGEITLAEWLDAVRASFEAESSLAALRSDLLMRRATLIRAAGSAATSALPWSGAVPDPTR